MSTEQAWEDMRAYNIRLEERAREAERALAEIEVDARWIVGQWQRLGDTPVHEVALAMVARTRAALRPSEDTSDES